MLWRNRTTAVRDACVLLALCALATAPVAVGQGGRVSHLWHVTGGYVWPMAISDQGLPPPITPGLLSQFQALLATYQTIGSNIPVSFDQWIVMCGVTDIREYWSLMWLWWNLGHQHALD